MKLGIVADEISRDFAQAVRAGKQLGLNRYEIRNLTTGRAPLCDPAEMKEVERVAEREEVEITALSPGLFKSVSDAAAFHREMQDLYPRAAELAHRWKLPGLIVFGFRRPGATESNIGATPIEETPSEVHDWLALAGEQACRDGLILMIEPEPVCWAWNARETAALIERSGGRSLAINYDPGNTAWILNRDPLDEFEAAAPWIANVHIKDLKPRQRISDEPDWVPAGEGIIDYRAHFAALRRIGYRGPVSLEPHMKPGVETLRRCQEACERLLSEGELS